MPIQPASDIRAERAYPQSAGSSIVEGEPCNCTAHALTFIFLAHHGVQEGDGVGCQLILGEANQFPVDPRLVTALHRVIDDCHAHTAHCARRATATLSSMMVVRLQSKKWV